MTVDRRLRVVEVVDEPPAWTDYGSYVGESSLTPPDNQTKSGWARWRNLRTDDGTRHVITCPVHGPYHCGCSRRNVRCPECVRALAKREAT